MTAPVPAPPLSGELERLHRLRQMQRRATGLLGVMAVGFIIVTVWGHGRGWSAYLQATLEASLVGGLADWFAVTALFRHPLGLPIPHTAVIPERKEQFGQTLGDFVQENFLSPDVLSERIASAELARRGARWLADEANAGLVVRRLADLAATVVDTPLPRLLETELTRAIGAVPLSATAGRILAEATAHGIHRDLLDRALDGATRLLDANRAAVQKRFLGESPWWLPDAVDERIFGRLFDGVQNLLREVRADPHHELRVELNRSVTALADRLQHSPELRAKGEELKAELLGRDDLINALGPLLADARAAIRVELAAADSTLRRRLASLMATTAARFENDPVLLEKAEKALESGARSIAGLFRDDIAGLVSGTIARWDGRETSRKLELLLGRDLQYIRINGTLVGGIAGLSIHIVARALA